MLTENLDDPIYSLRDLLAVMAAARHDRRGIDEVIDKLLDLAGEA